jgi:hypothetical protein
MSALFFTHCSRTKDDRLKGTGTKVSPCKLYKARFVQDFCDKCASLGLDFAIFSDLHAFVFPAQKIEWYDKDPREVLYNERAKNELFESALSTLRQFDAGYFYHLPENVRPLHRLYAELVEYLTRMGVRIVDITDLSQIDTIAKKGSVSEKVH